MGLEERTFKVEKITDKVTEKADEEKAQNVRTVTLNAEDMSITIKGDPDELAGFVTGYNVELQVQTCQSQ